MINTFRFLVVAGVAFSLVACSSVGTDDLLPDKSVEYKREAQAKRNLEIPPDLTSTRINDRMSVPDNLGGAANYSEYMVDRKLRGVEGGGPVGKGVLPPHPDIKVERDGNARWLLVNGDADAVWDKLLDFWQDQGILLAEENPQLGTMRTAWLDNRANISRDFVTDAIRSVFDGLYETSLRDSYRVRLERESGDQTGVYLTHYGMEEKLVPNSTGDSDRTIWEPRPRDPELEAVMLRRIMVFLGAAKDRAQAELTAKSRGAETRSQLVQGSDGVKLVIAEDFPRAWRLVGLSLDRIGFAVEDRDRSQGLYFVRYNDPAAEVESGGFLSSLAFWKEDKPKPETEYHISLAQQGANTVVTVLDSKGQRDHSNTSTRILKLLREQIR